MPNTLVTTSFSQMIVGELIRQKAEHLVSILLKTVHIISTHHSLRVALNPSQKATAVNAELCLAA